MNKTQEPMNVLDHFKDVERFELNELAHMMDETGVTVASVKFMNRYCEGLIAGCKTSEVSTVIDSDEAGNPTKIGVAVFYVGDVESVIEVLRSHGFKNA